MLLKKLHAPTGDGGHKVIGVQLRHTGVNPEQNFSSNLVASGLADGWIIIDGDTLTLKADNAELVYTIKRRPGYYSVFDGSRIPLSQEAEREWLTQPKARLAAKEAQSYLTKTGNFGKPSPDANWPAGYAVLNHYECVLDAGQHDKYKAVPGALALSQVAEG